MQTVHFTAGETILNQGEEGNTAFLIVDGGVDVIVGDGANARTVGSLEAGDVFGEMSLLDPGPRSATVKATADTECVVATYDEFIATMKEDPERAVVFMQTLVRRLRHMNELMAAMGPGKRRLVDVLRDWQKSLEASESELTEEDKRHYYATMYLGI